MSPPLLDSQLNVFDIERNDAEQKPTSPGSLATLSQTPAVSVSMPNVFDNHRISPFLKF